MKKFHVKYRTVNQHEFNLHLEESKHYKTIYTKYQEWRDADLKSTRWTRWLYISRLNCYLTYKIGNDWVNVTTNLSMEYSEDPEEILQPTDPIRAYMVFSRVVKPKDYSDIPIANLGAYQNSHIDKKGSYDYAISYDVNKAFFNACNNPMPVELIGRGRAPKVNEMGFSLSGLNITIGPSDEVCAYVFTLERMPKLDHWIEIYTNKLKKAKTKKEIKKYKDEINMSIGNLAHHNPFLRNAILYYSNEFIKSKVDEHTIWSNTDNIVSTVPRPDLVIGDEIGQFKIEHEGKFIQNGTGYQWVDDKFSNKGVSKDQVALFKEVYGREFRLGTDSIELLNILLRWNYDEKTGKLRKVSIKELRERIKEEKTDKIVHKEDKKVQKTDKGNAQKKSNDHKDEKGHAGTSSLALLAAASKRTHRSNANKGKA